MNFSSCKPSITGNDYRVYHRSMTVSTFTLYSTIKLMVNIWFLYGKKPSSVFVLPSDVKWLSVSELLKL